MSVKYLKPIKWWHWIVGIFLLTGGISVTALSYLTQSPQPSNCLAELQSKDSVSATIYCATATVDEQNPDKLSRAIELVNATPQDNPLRANGDKLIDRWSQALMYLSEKAFHEGDLPKAIEIAELIPANISLRESARGQIKKWQSIWSQAEGIYKNAEAKMKENESKDWYAALSTAKQLRTLGNEYWASTKYQELVHNIQDIREEKEKSEKAENEAKLAASNFNKDLGDKEAQTDDFAQLKKARVLANSGKLDDMRAAVIEASLIITEPHYQEARKLMTNIEDKIAVLEDSKYLENAKKIASKNDEISLEMAINEAGLVAKDRPLYKQAAAKIATWNKLRSQIASPPNKVETSFKKENGNQENLEKSEKIELEPVLEKPKMTDTFPSSPQIQLDDMKDTYSRLEELENREIQQKR
jgi:hypothetical protein